MNDSRFRLERVRPPVSNEEINADIRRVADLAGTRRQHASDLTGHAVVFRYLDPREPDQREAALALGTAQRVVQDVTALLIEPLQSTEAQV